MAATVTLDAMIKREDFAVSGDQAGDPDAVKTLSVENLSSSGLISALLRKPDFQRETNHWTPEQLVSFLESFLDSELIPSIILWRSESYVFAIDGGHRLSALRAWIEDDYGDGYVSRNFYSGEISDEQLRIARRTRTLVGKRVGHYKSLRAALTDSEGFDELTKRRAGTMATRQLNLQWVTGDSSKAESSFFKINTLGTPLHKTEEILLRNRERCIAIAARSIVRSATGHKYWSKFAADRREAIEESAKSVHGLLFSPEIQNPIKTLDLPLGGAKSPIVGLGVLMEWLACCDLDDNNAPKKLDDFAIDPTGDSTIELLKKASKVAGRITGNGAASLGLHPAIYFYSDNGRHVPDLFIAMTYLFAKKAKNNDKNFFKLFSESRSKIESILIGNKALILQALQTLMSKKRVAVTADFIEAAVKKIAAGEDVSEEWIVQTIATNSRGAKILAIKESISSTDFTDETRSAAFLKKALDGAMRCSICDGYLDINKAVSYDHKTRKQDGGDGSVENCDLTHPFCNTGVKN